MAQTEQIWQVYIVLTQRQRLYTGITTDMQRRWQQHGEGKGAKFFRGDKPKQLLYLQNGHDRASATRQEIAIKQLTRPQKLLFIKAQTDNLAATLSLPAIG